MPGRCSWRPLRTAATCRTRRIACETCSLAIGRLATFHLIERGEMSKTDGDQLSDFNDVYEFEEALDNQYRIDVSRAFS